MPAYDGNTYTYTNSLLVNKKVLVPVYNKNEDAAALQLYRHLLPGHQVTGFDCQQIIGSNGAIHCIAKLVMRDPLEICHRPVMKAVSGQSIQIQADVCSHHPVKYSGVTLHWRRAALDAFQTRVMESLDRIRFFTSFTVPLQAARIEYYVRAEDETGMYETVPEEDVQPNIYVIEVSKN
jgi:hypothetical protein